MVHRDNERPRVLRGQASSNKPQSGPGMLEENVVAFILVHGPFMGEAIPTEILGIIKIKLIIGINILQQLRVEAEH